MMMVVMKLQNGSGPSNHIHARFAGLQKCNSGPNGPAVPELFDWPEYNADHLS